MSSPSKNPEANIQLIERLNLLPSNKPNNLFSSLDDVCGSIVLVALSGVRCRNKILHIAIRVKNKKKRNTDESKP